jgi:hypothetical protein
MVKLHTRFSLITRAKKCDQVYGIATIGMGNLVSVPSSMVDELCGIYIDEKEEWSGREDLNLRPPGPEPGALPG